MSRNSSLNNFNDKNSPASSDTVSLSNPTRGLVSVPSLTLPMTPSDVPVSALGRLSPKKVTGMRTRQYYGSNSSYIMDAKTRGNVGRYINVSELERERGREGERERERPTLQ